MDILVATKNKGKVKEIKSILNEFNVLCLDDVGIDVDVEENGTTFEENALIKAREISKLTGKTVIADDSGLEVDYLNGAPGIYSARYCEGSDDDRVNKLLSELKDVPQEKRGAHFTCAIAIVYTDGREYTFRGECYGIIDTEKKGENGFGYDPVFYFPEFKKTLAEVDADVKNKVSHRSIALEKLKTFLMGENA